MSSEGRHEIGAAKQRLATAKTQETSASKNKESAKAMEQSAKLMLDTAMKNMETAKKNSEAAESQFQSSQKEIQEADKFWKEAEKRWEVIDVDYNGDDSPGLEIRKKRRKVSLSTEGSDAAARDNAAGAPVRQADGDGVSVDTAAAVRHPKKNGTRDAGRTTRQTALQPNNDDGIGGSVSRTDINVASRLRSSTPLESQSIRTSIRSIGSVRVKVEGCGSAQVNGTYTFRSADSNYLKEGTQKGKTAAFLFLIGHKIHRGFHIWYICTCNAGGRTRTLYHAPRIDDVSKGPPSHGWKAVGEGVSPGPQLKIV